MHRLLQASLLFITISTNRISLLHIYICNSCSVLNTLQFKGLCVEWGNLKYMFYHICQCFVYQYFIISEHYSKKWFICFLSTMCTLLKYSTYYLSNMYFVLFRTVDCVIGTPSVSSSENPPPPRTEQDAWQKQTLQLKNFTVVESHNQEDIWRSGRNTHTHTERGKHMYANINHPHEGYLTLTSIFRKPVACTAGEATDSLQPDRCKPYP